MERWLTEPDIKACSKVVVIKSVTLIQREFNVLFCCILASDSGLSVISHFFLVSFCFLFIPTCFITNFFPAPVTNYLINAYFISYLIVIALFFLEETHHMPFDSISCRNSIKCIFSFYLSAVFQFFDIADSFHGFYIFYFLTWSERMLTEYIQYFYSQISFYCENLPVRSYDWWFIETDFQ